MIQYNLWKKISREMALQNLTQLKSIFKEAFGAASNVAKFFCGLHVVNSYLCTFALVNQLTSLYFKFLEKTTDQKDAEIL